tara:strand:- start:32 stop:478 length:447 start_codon:yes stop_codon:yes gene_type:complete
MYNVQNLLDKEHIKILKDYWNRNIKNIKHKDGHYNLHNIEILYGKKSDEEYNKVLLVFDDITTRKADKHYFLNYVENSFARIHNDVTGNQTFVTLLEQSNNLSGGQTLTGDLQYIDLKVGQTLIYDHDFKHGVARVNRGNRKVFVVWY